MALVSISIILFYNVGLGVFVALVAVLMSMATLILLPDLQQRTRALLGELGLGSSS